MVKSTEQVIAEIQAAIGQRPTYNLDIPDFSSILSNHKGIDLGAPTDFSDYAIFDQSTKKKKKKKSGLKPDFWGMVSGTLGQPSGIMTDSAYHTIQDLKNWKGSKKSLAKKLEELLIEDSVVGSIGRGMKHGAKEQVKDWKDGHFSWGDLGAGFLHGADKGWKRGEDIMEEVGTKNKWGKIGGGIGIDIALDPLTYLTGGLSTATKLGKVAEAAKMLEISKGLGLGKFKKVDDLLAAVSDTIKAKHGESLANVANTTRQQYSKFPHLVDDMVTKKVADHQKQLDELLKTKLGDIADQIKTARNTTFNANINKFGVSIPFSNKATMALGNIGKRNLLHRTEATVNHPLVDDLLERASKGDGSLKSTLDSVVKERYGVNSLDELTKTQFEDLHTHLAPVIEAGKKSGLPHVAFTQKIVEHDMPKEDFARLMNDFRTQNVKWDVVKNQLNDILVQTGHDAKLRSSIGSHLAEMVADYWEHTTTGMRGISKADRAARAESMKWASKFLKDSDKYKVVKNTVTKIHPHGTPEEAAGRNAYNVNKATEKLKNTTYNEMNNAKTGFEHWLDKKNPFDARTLQTGDKLVDSMANHISDANSQRLGETAMYTKGMEAIDKFVKKVSKNMTPEQKSTMMKNAIYHLEKKAPDSYGAGWTPTRKEAQLADLIRPLVKKVGEDDMDAGVLSKITKNYFPHVANKGGKEVDDMIKFDARHSELNGLSNENKFDKSRKSFKTIADQDNYVAKLAKLISKETDPAKKELLQTQMDRVENFFDTDVVTALTRRIKEGTRARAMKAMQGKLSKFGMMKSFQKGEAQVGVDGLKKLDMDEAKKLGLGKGTHYIHPDVLEGMKRTDEIFTDQGMKTMARHLAAISDIWRPLVTYYKPSHYINNFIGNAFQNLAAGVKIKDYNSAFKLYTKYKAGKALTKLEEQTIKNAYKHNIISGGFLFDSKGTYEFEKSNNLEKVAKFVSNNKGVKAIRGGGEFIDDLSRLANYMNGVDKYGSVEKAAGQVREYLFNYNELTKLDRKFRVAVPFWNWTKRNIPLQMKLLMEQPKYAMNTKRFRDFWNEDQKGEDWQKETGIHIPKATTDMLGLKDERYTTVPAPANDLTLMNNPVSFLGSTNPALKMGVEMGMNKKFYTGKPISYGSNEIQAEDIPKYIASNLGIGGDMYKAGTGDTSLMEFLVNLFKSTSKVNPKGGS